MDDGNLYFTSGPHTRKARNLAVNPACTIRAIAEALVVSESAVEKHVNAIFGKL